MGLIPAVVSKGIDQIPGSELWRLSHEELEILESIVCKIPRYSFEAVQFFVSRNGAPALFYKEFPLEVVAAKNMLEKQIPRLKEENGGSRWPKTTLGSGSQRVLDEVHATELFRLVMELSKEVKGEKLEVNDICVVAFQNRSLECRWLTFPVRLPAVSGIAISEDDRRAYEEAARRAKAMREEFSPAEILKGQSSPLNRARRPWEPCFEYTLVVSLEGSKLLDCIRRFSTAVDQFFPGLNEWFKPESLHVTLRGLMVKSSIDV